MTAETATPRRRVDIHQGALSTRQPSLPGNRVQGTAPIASGFRRYSQTNTTPGGCMRQPDKHVRPSDVMQLFSQILDGVEAAHFQGVIHRDLKPENILYDGASHALAVADFGIASFTADALLTAVETAPGQRLANFQYAAPEQRERGREIAATADIYALGLMLNEMFTGSVPHGTQYRSINETSSDYGYLDRIVSQMMCQNPPDRPSSIAKVKQLVLRHQQEFVSLQRLSKINNTVTRVGQIDEPLAYEPPTLSGAYWDGGLLHLTLDRPVTHEWVDALNNIGNYSSVAGAEPSMVRFSGSGRTCRISASEGSAQHVINYFKTWLPAATKKLREDLAEKARREEVLLQQKLRKEREEEERLLRVNQKLVI